MAKKLSAMIKGVSIDVLNKETASYRRFERMRQSWGNLIYGRAQRIRLWAEKNLKNVEGFIRGVPRENVGSTEEMGKYLNALSSIESLKTMLDELDGLDAQSADAINAYITSACSYLEAAFGKKQYGFFVKLKAAVDNFIKNPSGSSEKKKLQVEIKNCIDEVCCIIDDFMYGEKNFYALMAQKCFKKYQTVFDEILSIKEEKVLDSSLRQKDDTDSCLDMSIDEQEMLRKDNAGILLSVLRDLSVDAYGENSKYALKLKYVCHTLRNFCGE